ncbi:hypothetical protein TNCV_3928511 [Trichonephila clavipes]|nr:hypothetical protein TNCV_3928511 [Trichonephila clavipes]
MGLRRISVLLYVIVWIWYTSATGSMATMITSYHSVGFFPVEKSQGFGALRRSHKTNRLSYSSAYCLYFNEIPAIRRSPCCCDVCTHPFPSTFNHTMICMGDTLTICLYKLLQIPD